MSDVKPIDHDPIAAVKRHEDQIALLERQVAALMAVLDGQLQTASGNQNVHHMWPTRSLSKPAENASPPTT